MEISNQELLELSLKIEREGKTFYKSLAKRIPDPQVKEFLLLMAKEEAQHEKQFKKLLETKGKNSYGWEKSQPLRKLIDKHFQTDIFPRLDTLTEQLPHFEGIQKAFDFAIESEKISAEFFSILGEACNNFEAKTLLVLLEKAEDEHLQRIKTLRKQFIKEPGSKP